MRTIFAAFAALSLSAVGSAATVTNTFDSAGDVTLSPTQSAGTWYTDRYAPSIFASGQTGGGRMGVLHHGLREADSAANRPGSFSSQFYDTQGRKYDLGLTGPVQRMAIDLYVDASSSDGVSAGIWGTGRNGANAISAYPILSYRQSATNAFDSGFYFFDTLNTSGGGWIEVLTTGVSAASWNSLEIVFTVGAGYEIFINGMSEFTYADTDTVSLENVILNGYNFGVDQDIYWDNFVASDDGTVIPLPTAGALGFFGVVALGARRRRIA
jgi:MYXO-CTERM domain-containing protein